ncbi:hypothetical protein [Actinomadura sp. 9N407]|uniref:hypothetical protein n=1 Tax=Actinomadura sp. 9N407 TaxID=3375154 RepID=UPI0037899B13
MGTTRWSVATTATVAVALLMSGCTGGGEPRESASASAAPTASWRPAEIRRIPPDPCRGVAAGTLRALRVAPLHSSSSGSYCYWGHSADERAKVRGSLTVTLQVHQPPRTRLSYGAADEARYTFRRPPGWEALGAGTPVRGLGEEAKIVRVDRPLGEQRKIVLAVRIRNLIVQVTAEQEASLDDEHGSAVPPAGEIEAGVAGAAGDILALFGARPKPAAAPAYGTGEVRKVGGVCASAAAAGGRLVPGSDGRDLTPAGTRMNGGCVWDTDGAYTPDLRVYAEAVAPSAATGETGTAVATAIFDAARGEATSAPKPGDKAKLDHYSFEKGRSRSSRILLRRGNLLVYVDHGRWHRPSKKTMDDEVAAVAEAVLNAQSRP